MTWLPRISDRRKRFALPLLCAWLALAGTPAAQQPHNHPQLKPESSEQLKSPSGLTEVGVLDGAAYRIDVPNDWNGCWA